MRVEVITSVHNPRVKSATKLRDARQRARQGRFLIDGARELLRAVNAGVALVDVFVCPALVGTADPRALMERLRRTHGLIEVAPRVFEKLAYGQRSEGVLAVAEAPHRSIAELRLPESPLVCVLEGVEKPGNFGAVLRSADAAGVSAVIVASGRCDLYNPNAIRSSLGAIFTLPICAASTTEIIAWLRERKMTIYAARVDATRDYTTAEFTKPCAIVLGSEAAGLSDAWARRDVEAIKIPMRGAADSLNVSAAAAVLFYEALRQRGQDSGFGDQGKAIP